jgi:hypothetical protein
MEANGYAEVKTHFITKQASQRCGALDCATTLQVGMSHAAAQFGSSDTHAGEFCHLTQNAHGCTPLITTMQNLLQGNNACPRHNKFMHVCECVSVKGKCEDRFNPNLH